MPLVCNLQPLRSWRRLVLPVPADVTRRTRKVDQDSCPVSRQLPRDSGFTIPAEKHPGTARLGVGRKRDARSHENTTGIIDFSILP